VSVLTLIANKILSLKNNNWRDDERKVETQRETRYLDLLNRVEDE